MSTKQWLTRKILAVNTAQRNRTTLNKIRQICYIIALSSLIWTLNIQALQYLLTPRVITIYGGSASIVEMVKADSIVSTTDRGFIENTPSAKSQESSAGAVGIEEMIREAFPQDQEDMIAIARAESRFKKDAVNVNTNGTKDCGIFQINEIHGYDCEWLKDPKNNIEAAKKVYAKQGKKAWVVYNHAIRNNLPIL